ncbi:coniferyl aldehyde dehydrogenase (plasmid) [Pseudoalteromonas sp. T1lg65]|uniref:coniferyl aldehyde dehydrogenase n=1 Tax=Pseudoalteromonas sp. T1lg65 TaxID=2077101 RepID=UPI003F7977B5
MIENTVTELHAQFTTFKTLFLQNPTPNADDRCALLDKLRIDILSRQDEFVSAATKDFGYRSEYDTLIADVMPCISHIRYLRNNLKNWLKPQSRFSGWSLLPTTARVEIQPKGVVGVIAPWNYPIQLAIVPVVTALAAGNKVLLKLSEYTPEVNSVIRKLFSPYREQVAVFEGETKLAEAFSLLPFDHLFFTGSTQVGRQVMISAAKNLTPVTLELGGKSPVIVTEKADLDKAAMSILMGKLTNAGQICVAPDYVLVHESVKQALVERLKKYYHSVYLRHVGLDHQTWIINDRQLSRLQGLVQDAQDKNATIWCAQTSEHERCLPLHIITDIDDSMTVMQEEIFGPLLPVKSVSSSDAAQDYVNSRPSPLACYVFSEDKAEISQLSKKLRCGTMAINETLLQVACESLPFGGFGESGMGQYHGKEGFVTLSHQRPILQSGNTTWRNKLLLAQSSLLMKPLKWLFLPKSKQR